MHSLSSCASFLCAMPRQLSPEAPDTRDHGMPHGMEQAILFRNNMDRPDLLASLTHLAEGTRNYSRRKGPRERRPEGLSLPWRRGINFFLLEAPDLSRGLSRSQTRDILP